MQFPRPGYGRTATAGACRLPGVLPPAPAKAERPQPGGACPLSALPPAPASVDRLPPCVHGTRLLLRPPRLRQNGHSWGVPTAWCPPPRPGYGGAATAGACMSLVRSPSHPG